jgi:hypothetical protein
MNIADYVILFIVAVLLILAIRYAAKHRNQCGGSCSNCPYGKECGRKERK